MYQGESRGKIPEEEFANKDGIDTADECWTDNNTKEGFKQLGGHFADTSKSFFQNIVKMI